MSREILEARLQWNGYFGGTRNCILSSVSRQITIVLEKIQRMDVSKKRRVTTNNNKIKELMEKQRIYEKQGKTYRCGVALDSDSIPEFVKEAEERKKELLGIQCPFYGCFVKGHKTTKAKKCQYRGVRNKEELNVKINAYLQKHFQNNTVSVVNSHLISPIPEIASMASKIPFTEGLQILNLLFINL